MHGAVPPGVEALGDPLGQLLVAGFERPDEALAQLGGVALELRPDVVHFGGGALTLEDASPDLDRVSDGLRGRLPTLRPLPDDPGRALIGDRQPLDHEAIVQCADHAVGGAGRLVDG